MSQGIGAYSFFVDGLVRCYQYNGNAVADPVGQVFENPLGGPFDSCEACCEGCTCTNLALCPGYRFRAFNTEVEDPFGPGTYTLTFDSNNTTDDQPNCRILRTGSYNQISFQRDGVSVPGAAGSFCDEDPTGIYCNPETGNWYYRFCYPTGNTTGYVYEWTTSSIASLCPPNSNTAWVLTSAFVINAFPVELSIIEPGFVDVITI